MKFQCGYVDLILDRTEQTSGDTKNFLDWTDVKVKKINKTRMIIGKAIYQVPLDNSYLIDTSVYKMQGGDYKLTPFKLPLLGFCDSLKEEKYFVADLAKHSELPYPVPCPLPKVIKYLKRTTFLK